MLIDSHCHLDHLDLTPFNGSLDAALSAAKALDVQYVLSVCTELEHVQTILNIANQYDFVYASVGLHPSEQAATEPDADMIANLAADPKILGIGEAGLDYHYGKDNRALQRERFRTHIRAATRIHKPLIIHSRDASEDTIEIMTAERANKVRGVMHCFTGTWEFAKQAMELGFYIGFAGIVTFKNAQSLQDVAKKMPLDRMLLETDSPYLTPVPYRGKPNQPGYVRYIAEHIANSRGIKYEVIAEATTQNFFDLFK